MDADALVSLQTCHKRGAETVLGGQDIFCNALFFHGFPQVVVDDHNICPEAKKNPRFLNTKKNKSIIVLTKNSQYMFERRKE